LYVLWLYFNLALIFLLMCSYISIYLFHILLDIGLRELFSWFIGLGFHSQQHFMRCEAHNIPYKWLWIKYSHLRIGSMDLMSSLSALLFGIELAYSHNLLFRFEMAFYLSNKGFCLKLNMLNFQKLLKRKQLVETRYLL